MIAGIYEFSFNGISKVYIGSSCNLLKRHKDHLNLLKTKKHYNKEFQEHYNIYGIDNLKYSILEYVDLENVKSKQERQELLFSKEQKYLNKYYAQEFIINPEDTRFFKLVYNKSAVARFNASENSLKKQKLVYQFTLEGVFIECYYNSVYAEYITTIDSASIRNTCINKRKSAGGYLWSYSHEVSLYQRKDAKKIYQYDNKMNLVTSFSSLGKARKVTGFDIRKHKKHSNFQYNYYWLFESELPK